MSNERSGGRAISDEDRRVIDSRKSSGGRNLSDEDIRVLLSYITGGRSLGSDEESGSGVRTGRSDSDEDMRLDDDAMAHGGYVKKYAHGGGVRKAKFMDS